MIKKEDIAAAISETIQDIVFYNGELYDVVKVLTDALPGTLAGLVSHDLKTGVTDFSVGSGLDPEFAKSYAVHYAYVNPWNETWLKLGNGILISEEMAPASSFYDTEFYQDWLGPQKDYDAGVGMRLNAGPDQIMYLSTHFSPKQQQHYGLLLPALYETTRRDLLKGFVLARKQLAFQEGTMARGAIAARFGQCAFVVARDMRIVDANDIAGAEFETGRTIRSVNGRLSITEHAADQLLKSIVQQLADGKVPPSDMLTFNRAGKRWLVRLTLLHIRASGGLSSFFRGGGLVLVLFDDISAKRDLSQSFGQAFHLTPAEQKLSELLARGLTIQQAAQALTITEGTARQRAKDIMGKTETVRQADLMLLMTRFLHC